MRIYERHPTMDAYRVGGSFTPYAIIATDKRFSDAELAAEFHNSGADFLSANDMDLLFDDSESAECLNRARDWMFHMESFATRPHYDEAEE